MSRAARRGRAVIAAALAAAACAWEQATAPVPVPTSVHGELTIAAHGPHDGGASEPVRQVSTWVPGAGYAQMQDNDIRGFLDGAFVHGWNQATQSHVRIGRPPWTRPFGEDEILRVLQRWGGLALPPDATVHGATLEVAIEKDAGREVEVLLYEVRKDWRPGDGGTLRNNTSPPGAGEVWWRDAAFGEQAWSLPGASHASETDPRADTGAMPLAAARHRPGQATLAFRSERLAAYATRRIREQRPLLFLLKLSDALEDGFDAGLAVYSAEQGDARNPMRRPRLTLEWSSPAQVAAVRQEILVEHGRTVDLPRLVAPGASRWSVGFVPAEGSERPTIEVRGGAGEAVSPWQSADLPFAADWDWIEVRVSALRDPIVLGDRFRTTLRDTWVRTAPPEAQAVRWRFVAPSGETRAIAATYAGDFVWTVDFAPDELGRWRYVVEHDLTWEPWRSAEGVFDVVPGDLEAVERQLRALLAEIEASGVADPESRHAAFGSDLHRLQRAAMGQLTHDGVGARNGHPVLGLIRDVRAALGSQPVADAPGALAQPWQ